MPDSLTIAWAADSSGNGLFKSNATQILNRDQTAYNKNTLQIYYQNNILHIPQGLTIKHLSIYNSLGQQVFAQPITSGFIGIKNLAHGNYIYELRYYRGIYRGKFTSFQKH